MNTKKTMNAGYFLIASILCTPCIFSMDDIYHAIDPIFQAIGVNNTPTTQLQALIHNNANLNSQDPGGNTALHMAIFRRNNNAALLLINSGANINIQNNMADTPLHIAVMLRNIFIVQALLTAGANRNLRNHNGQTPRDLAIAMEDNQNIANLL